MPATDSSEAQDSARGDTSVRKTGRGNGRWRLVLAVLGLCAAFVIVLRVSGVVSPKPCTACHDRGAFRAETRASGHAEVGCRSCHAPSGSIGRMVFAVQQPLHAYVPRGSAVAREAAAVPDERCRSCHEGALQGVVSANGIRTNHSTCAVGAECTDCHSTTAHGAATKWIRSYDMDRCLACHLASGNVACDLCHEGRDVADRVKFSTFAVTHGPSWQTSHGMGDSATCAVCHKAEDCADCHGAGVPHESNFVSLHSTYAAQTDARCSTCHKEAFCSACHGIEMPHPAGFTAGHVKAAKSDRDLCARCHAESDCKVCHEKHAHPGGAISAAPSPGGEQ